MKNESNEKAADPIGLNLLKETIAAVVGKDESAHIDEVYQMVMRRYTALQDRYRLLKASNRQLAEEVAWLRDQCDDFTLEEGEDTDSTEMNQ